ncbi:Hypothetical predicted protein [Lecanosticta acicola]|uniref:2EXR domain-containing protein n=1 Tax=Lecanosticta acicola TaxID=111012 RepID=A0AAI9EDM1_9PEZI|nr:Hypothetical predicted protein [Lecanosticta acicola]
MAFSRKPPSRLLNLPAEIRNLIFEYAVTSQKTVVTFRPDHFQRDSFTAATQPPLTRVSRQVRSESLPIYYECNDFVLHTESPKADDALIWLTCNWLHLRKLRRLSFWIRYVPSANSRASSQGAICVTMVRPKKNSAWEVNKHWSWVTVVRKPAGLEDDVKLMLEKLDTMTREVSREDANPDGYFRLMTDLRAFYIQEKLS